MRWLFTILFGSSLIGVISKEEGGMYLFFKIIGLIPELIKRSKRLQSPHLLFDSKLWVEYLLNVVISPIKVS